MENIIPGFVQGLARVTFSYPFDVVKINMQQNKYDTCVIAFKKIIGENPKKLYKGASLSYMTIPIDRTIQYYFLENYICMYNPYFIGFITSLFSCIYNVPINYLCTNIILNKNKNIKNLIMNNYKFFYYGASIEFCRSTIASSIYLGTYFTMREKYNKNNDVNISAFFGGLSSIICWSFIFPLDGLKTDIHATNNNKIFFHIKNRYNNYGLRNFYKGITPIIIRALPSNIISMYIYEYTRNYIKKI